MAYRFEGKQKTLSLGAYPATGLKEAREARDNAKALLARGVDPSEEKRRVKAAAETMAKIQGMTFEVVGREWFGKKTSNLSADYRRQLLSHLENHLFPFIGNKPVAELEPAEILAAVRHTEKRGAALDAFAVVCESSWLELSRGEYRSRLNPHAACQSVLAFAGRYRVPFLFAGSRSAAEYMTWGFLRSIWKGQGSDGRP